jgi:nucleoside-diphosphate-sugar epimerase
VEPVTLPVKSLVLGKPAIENRQVRVLVLGGTHHVGRAVVEAALARGDSVTTATRGVSGPPASGARAVHADRTDKASLGAALDGGSWDAVIDTWSAAPRVVLESAQRLVARRSLRLRVASVG